MSNLAYNIGIQAAIKEAGMFGGLGNLVSDAGRGAGQLLRSTNPWISNAVGGAVLTGGMNASIAPKGHRTDAFMKGIVPGAVGGMAWHGLTKGTESLVGAPKWRGPEGGINVHEPKTFGGRLKSHLTDIKALSGLNPNISSGAAVGNIIRHVAPTAVGMAGGNEVLKALGVPLLPPSYSDQSQAAPPQYPPQYGAY